jgi:hypothetical protein
MRLRLKMLQKDWGKGKVSLSIRVRARVCVCMYVCIQNLATIVQNILQHGTTEAGNFFTKDLVTPLNHIHFNTLC